MKNRIIPFLLILAMLFTIVPVTGNVEAAKKVVKVKQIKLNKSKVTLTEGKVIQLKYSLTPKKTTQKKVSWSTSNKKVAKVSKNGRVTGVKRGTATITVKVNGTNKKAKCKVTVVCSHKYKTTTVKSTCVRNGYTYKKCQRCGASKRTILSLEKHKYKVKTVDATCTKDGYMEKKCTVCNKQTTEVLEAKHDYVETTIPATCTKDGSVTRKCKRCNDSSVEVLKAIGHSFDYKTKTPNCFEAGYQITKCLRCDYSKTEELEKLDHYFIRTASEQVSCQRDGYVTYRCVYCNSTKTDVTPKVPCSYSWNRTEKKASCTEEGSDVYRCYMCGDEYTKTLPKKDHEMWYQQTVAATCTTFKYEIYKCYNCDYTEKKNWGTEYKHGYSRVVEEHAPASCTDEYYVIRQCNDCGGKFRKDIEMQEWRHVYELDHYTSQPDCDHTGRAVFKCSVCDKTKEEDVGKLHDCDIVSSDLQYHYMKCKLCGDEVKEYNDQEYTIDLGNGETTTVVGHYDLEMADEVFELLNEYRVSKSRYKFKKPAVNSEVYQAALIRAVETYYIYDHERPNGKPLNSLVGGSTYGENLSVRGESAQELIQAWKDSPDHNKNMLNTVTSKCGVAIFCIRGKTDNGIGYKYAHRSVQVFGN